MKVIFVQPSDFLRSCEKTNAYFDPIMSCVGADWMIFLPKGEHSGYPTSHVRYYGLVLFWQTWFWRVAHVLMPWVPAWKVHYMFGRVARPFLREWGRADVITTIAGLFNFVLAGAFPNKRIVDIQHGLIYSRHTGYFAESGFLMEAYRKFKNREFWLYGQGYADCFFKNPENEKWIGKLGDPSCRVKVIGDVVRAGTRTTEVKGEGDGEQRNLAVIASQMTTDFDVETLAKMKAIYEGFMDGLKGAKGVRVVFRHHPRFGDAIDLSDWKTRYDWVDFGDKRPWSDIYAEALCVATINSTCAFDAAAQGVPTVLLDGTSLGWNNMMVDEYDYPLRDLSVNEILALSEKDWSAVRDKLKKWYNTYYTPFSPERALQLLKGEI